MSFFLEDGDKKAAVFLSFQTARGEKTLRECATMRLKRRMTIVGQPDKAGLSFRLHFFLSEGPSRVTGLPIRLGELN